MHALLLLSLLLTASPAPGVRLLDLDADGHLDQLRVTADGQLQVALNVGGRSFQTVQQPLPRVDLLDVLSGDLDGDGLLDLYLLSPGDNVALLGRGGGVFREATLVLGLADAGHALSAERIDIDGDMRLDLLLHNVQGDVIFWNQGKGFLRSADTPEVNPGTTPEPGLAVSSPPPRSATYPSVPVSVPDLPTLLPDVATTTQAAPDAGAPALDPAQIADLAVLADHLSVVFLDDGTGTPRKTLRLSGVNLQLVNGLRATNGYATDPGEADPALTMVNGLGNLIVGYNELRENGNLRTGSHNLILGIGQNFSSFGSLVAGAANDASGPHTQLLGGLVNGASVLGAVVIGGSANHADGELSALMGGLSNAVGGIFSALVGGQFGSASGDFGSVLGGSFNQATGGVSTVTGGESNAAGGLFSTVSGGASRQTLGPDDWAAGGLFEDS